MRQIRIAPATFVMILLLAIGLGWLIAFLAEPNWIRFAKESRKDYKGLYDSLDLKMAADMNHEPLPEVVGGAFVRNYRENIKPLLQTANPTGNISEAFWIPLNELSGYVNNLDPDDNDGIRVYFAQINIEDIPPGNDALRSKLERFNGYMTCVFMATRKETDSQGRTIHVDNIRSGGVGVNLPNDVNELCPPPNCVDQGAKLGQD